MHRFAGQYMNGLDAGVLDVEVVVEPLAVKIVALGGLEALAVWPRAGLIIDTISVGMVHLQSGSNPAMLSVNDKAITSALGGRAGSKTRPVLIALRLLAALAAIVGAVWLALEPLSTFVALNAPRSWEDKLGDAVYRALSPRVCVDARGQAAANRLVAKLSKASPNGETFDVRLVDDPAVNAFALPGGKILINRGLLEAAESPDEVAGVLAHEMQHVIQHHAMAGLVRGLAAVFFWQIAVGDYSGFLVVDPSSAYTVATLKFSRSSEAEADAGAMTMLNAAKISPKGFADFFTRLEEESIHIPALLSTHPTSDSRAKLAQGATLKGQKTAPSLRRSDWLALQGACGGKPKNTDAE